MDSRSCRRRIGQAKPTILISERFNQNYSRIRNQSCRGSDGPSAKHFRTGPVGNIYDFLPFPSNGGINDDTSQSVQRRMSICKTEIHQWTVEAVEGGVRSDFRPFPSNGGNIDQLPFRSSQKWIQWTLTFTSSLSCIVAQASVKRWAASKGRKHMYGMLPILDIECIDEHYSKS